MEIIEVLLICASQHEHTLEKSSLSITSIFLSVRKNMPTLFLFINLVIFISCVNELLLIYRLRLKNLAMGNVHLYLENQVLLQHLFSCYDIKKLEIYSISIYFLFIYYVNDEIIGKSISTNCFHNWWLFLVCILHQ